MKSTNECSFYYFFIPISLHVISKKSFYLGRKIKHGWYFIEDSPLQRWIEQAPLEKPFSVDAMYGMFIYWNWYTYLFSTVFLIAIFIIGEHRTSYIPMAMASNLFVDVKTLRLPICKRWFSGSFLIIIWVYTA